MWSYFGAKTNIVNFYPPPRHGKIIEPFAGTARYSLKYFDRDILLVDKYEVVVKIWQWLQKCSPGDIQRLPHKLEVGVKLSDMKWDCIEARWLIGFLICFGATNPRNTITRGKVTDRPNHINFHLNKISKNLFKIKHWKIIHGDYQDLSNEPATWFIDPPYQNGNSAQYKNGKIDYDHLGTWCQGRGGQVIVCENTKADWLPFKKMVTHRGQRNNLSEAIWTNHESPYDYQQGILTLGEIES